MYTWGPNNLMDDNKSKRHGSLMINFIHGIQTLHWKKQPRRNNSRCPNTAKGTSPHLESKQVICGLCSSFLDGELGLAIKEMIYFFSTLPS